MSSNKNLHKASKAKDDEYYTQLCDIEEELVHYRKHFKDKIVFCNCDDPEWSNFWKYFELNFDFLQLKKLIATHYNKGGESYKLELIREKDEDGIVFLQRIRTPLIGDGDFRSPECVDLLKEADIVVTNPPFSLFREYILQLINYEKSFIIIGNKNALTFKEMFTWIKFGKIWLGNNVRSMWFRVPKGKNVDKDYRIDDKGNIYVSAPSLWYTNLDFKKRHEDLQLCNTYNPIDYPKYDNYDAINVDKVVKIPADYFGIMGVPVTFLTKYNPKQFEILGMASSACYSEKIVGIPFKGDKDARPLIKGKNTYARIFIKRRKEEFDENRT